MMVKYAIKELTEEGRLVEVVTREMYDYEDGHMLANARCDSLEEAEALVRQKAGSIRHAREVVIVAVMDVPEEET